jgi:hypothetical protein
VLELLELLWLLRILCYIIVKVFCIHCFLGLLTRRNSISIGAAVSFLKLIILIYSHRAIIVFS